MNVGSIEQLTVDNTALRKDLIQLATLTQEKRAAIGEKALSIRNTAVIAMNAGSDDPKWERIRALAEDILRMTTWAEVK